MVNLLLERGADVYAKSKLGNTAFTLSRGRHTDIVKLLKLYGAVECEYP